MDSRVPFTTAGKFRICSRLLTGRANLERWKWPFLSSRPLQEWGGTVPSQQHQTSGADVQQPPEARARTAGCRSPQTRGTPAGEGKNPLRAQYGVPQRSRPGDGRVGSPRGTWTVQRSIGRRLFDTRGPCLNERNCRLLRKTTGLSGNSS